MTDYTHWHVGMKVTGKRHERRMPEAEKRHAREIGFTTVKFGVVYTIREITVISLHNRPVVALRFEEIDNRHLHYEWSAGEPAFRASMFEPVQTGKTDISVFTAMLNQKHERIPDEVAS